MTMEEVEDFQTKLTNLNKKRRDVEGNIKLAATVLAAVFHKDKEALLPSVAETIKHFIDQELKIQRFNDDMIESIACVIHQHASSIFAPYIKLMKNFEGNIHE